MWSHRKGPVHPQAEVKTVIVTEKGGEIPGVEEEDLVVAAWLGHCLLSIENVVAACCHLITSEGEMVARSMIWEGNG